MSDSEIDSEVLALLLGDNDLDSLPVNNDAGKYKIVEKKKVASNAGQKTVTPRDENPGKISKGNTNNKSLKPSLADTIDIAIDPRPPIEKPLQRLSDNFSDALSSKTTINREMVKKDEPKIDKCLHSGIRIVDRIVSKSDFNCAVSSRKYLKINKLPIIFKDNNDVEGDWITSGVIVRKTGPYKSSSGNDYSIWTLSDLMSLENKISVFLFKNTHIEHRKEQIGTVIGVLNPNFMPPRDPEKGKKSDLAFSVENAKKIIRLGMAYDYGTCKHVYPKSGEKCTNFINKALTQHCEYHILKIHAQMRNKRLNLSGVYTPAPNINKKQASPCQAFVHQGKAYYPNIAPIAKNSCRDNTTAIPSKGTVFTTSLISRDEFKSRLSIQSPGSMQLKRSLQGKTEEKENNALTKRPKLETADNFFKKHLQKPQLGLGASGNFINLAESTRAAAAKARAIQLARKCGGFKKQDPNGRRKALTEAEKQSIRQRRLEIDNPTPEKEEILNGPSDLFYNNPEPPRKTKIKSLNEAKTTDKPTKTTDKPKSKGILSSSFKTISLDSVEGKRLMKAQSINCNIVKEQELDRMMNYFDALEKFEFNEERLLSLKEMKVTVYVCNKCHTATQKQLQTCIANNHLVKKSFVLKKFFKCVSCKQKVDVIGHPFPDKPCQKCGSSKWEKCSMYNERKAPKLESEKLVVRGEMVERKTKFGFASDD